MKTSGKNSPDLSLFIKRANNLLGAAARYALHYVPLRHRNVLTRHDTLRWRYKMPLMVAATALPLVLAGYVTAPLAAYVGGGKNEHPLHVYQTAQSREGQAPAMNSDAVKAVRGLVTAIAEDAKTQAGSLMKQVDSPAPKLAAIRTASDAARIQPAAAALPSKYKKVTIGKGDTLAGVLDEAGASAQDAHLLAVAMKKYFDPRNIRPGQEVSVRFDPNEDGDYGLSEMDFGIDKIKTVRLERNDDGAFVPELHEKEMVTDIKTGRATIKVSLYGSAEQAGIPASVISNMIHIYSWDVDFQRDIRPGDTLEVLYEMLETKDGSYQKSGDILYARLSVNGHDIPVYRFEMKNGDVDYFTKDGKSVRKALMRTPVNGARISSTFGMREHPVLGYSKMHKGIDFAAPRGTPVYAAGDGTIERANRWSTYGNYIRIRHNATIKTAYAHLQKFGPGIHTGSRVKQGQVIAYIGTTGRSTGPHLHYEVIKNGRQVNPATVKLPQGETLKGKDLVAFKAQVEKRDNEFARLSREDAYAGSNDAVRNGVN